MAEKRTYSTNSGSGCLTCRSRQKSGCDNGKPQCNNCIIGGLPCGEPSDSLTSTVASSASGLLRDALASPGNHIGNTLSRALHEGGKAGPSSGIAASASNSIHQPIPRPEFATATRFTSESDTFRSSVRQSNAPDEAFEGMTIDQFLQSEPQAQGNVGEEAQRHLKGKKAVYTFPNDDVTSPDYNTDLASAWYSANFENAFRDENSNAANDGDEVVKLLSDPTSQPAIWKGYESDENYTITEDQMQVARWFTQKIQEGQAEREQLQRVVAAARGGRAFQDFASIFDEIESYHEEVWGYIGPLVEAARQEQRGAEPANSEDGPAVHRLRMIVAHLHTPILQSSGRDLV